MAKQTRQQRKKAAKTAAKSTQAKPTPPKASKQQGFWSQYRRLPIIAAILALTFAVYSPNIGHEFVHWDDDRNIFENPHITTLSGDNFWQNTKEIFTSDVIGNYNPLTIWTFGLEKLAFGLDQPGYFHLTNILLHLLCVLLVFRLAHLLGLSRVGAVVVTLLFAIHPMRVESVAWVTERKDVLYGAFYLSALVLYCRYRSYPSAKLIAGITVLFALSLFSKIQAVILPMSMLCIDYYLDDKMTWRNVWSKWHYFAMSIFFGVLGIKMLGDQGSLGTNENTSIVQRLFIGSYSYCVYLMKLIVPYELSPLYPYPQKIGTMFYVSMLALPATLAALYVSWKRGIKVVVFGLLFFIFNIIFLLQILGAGQGFLADRFTYIAYFGLFFILGWGAEQLSKAYPLRKRAIWGAIGLYLAGLTFVNYQQNLIWKNSDTMWSHVIKYYDKVTLPYGNRANYLRDRGQTKRAIQDYNMAIALKDENPAAYNSRGKLFFNAGNNRDTLQMALRDYSKAISYEPKNGEYYSNRGATYARLGDIDRAIADMDKGIQFNPKHAVGYLNRSVMYNQKGNFAMALKDIESYLKLKPYHADMWYEKGRAMRQVNQVQESIAAFSRAIEINPKKGIFYYERGRTKASLGDKAGGRSDLQQAIQQGFKNIDPAFRADVGL